MVMGTDYADLLDQERIDLEDHRDRLGRFEIEHRHLLMIRGKQGECHVPSGKKKSATYI